MSTPSSKEPLICVPHEGKSVINLASGDAYITINEKNEGFNNEGIIIDESPKTDGLIKWRLTNNICECTTIKKVTLQLYIVGPTGGDGFVHIMNPTWDENTVTWKNAPESSGPPLGRIGSYNNETWVDVDVTG